MGAAAVAATLAVGYVGAGTVEFVVDRGEFWFLEMNTRLQVEHPVTEMITGLDLVEWQLRVAAGEKLPALQGSIACSGHAIEARLYAEDPERDFAPSIGRIARLRLPPIADGVRVDTGVREGDSVSVHYDAMVAKLICHARDRAEALGRLRLALKACEVAGVATNLDLLQRIVAHPAFVAGGIDTGFIAAHAGELLTPRTAPSPEVLAAAALSVLLEELEAATREAAASADSYSPWHARDGWWLNAARERVLGFVADGASCPVRLCRSPVGWQIAVGATTLLGRASRAGDGRIAVELDGVRELVAMTQLGGEVTLRWRGETWRLTLPDPAVAAEAGDESGGRLAAPIPGQVTAVHAVPGQQVVRGEVLVVLEAMKTVFRLTAPADGTVADVLCRPGEMVEEEQVLVRFAEVEE